MSNDNPPSTPAFLTSNRRNEDDRRWYWDNCLDLCPALTKVCTSNAQLEKVMDTAAEFVIAAKAAKEKGDEEFISAGEAAAQKYWLDHGGGQEGLLLARELGLDLTFHFVL